PNAGKGMQRAAGSPPGMKRATRAKNTPRSPATHPGKLAASHHAAMGRRFRREVRSPRFAAGQCAIRWAVTRAPGGEGEGQARAAAASYRARRYFFFFRAGAAAGGAAATAPGGGAAT